MPTETTVDQSSPFIAIATEAAKTIFVNMLQIALSDSSTPQEFRWDDVESKRKLSIYRGWPQRVEFPTAIVVSVGSGTYDVPFLGSDTSEITEIYDTGGVLKEVHFLTPIKFNIELEIMSKSVEDRDRLFDIVMLDVNHLFKKKLESLGLGYTKISGSGESEEERNGSWYYSHRMTIEIQSQFIHRIPASKWTTINALKVVVTPTI